MKKIFTLLFLFSALNPALYAKAEKAIGRLIKPNKELNLPYDYYMTIQKSDGKVLAFPVKSAKVDLKKLDKRNTYLIEFQPLSEDLTVGEKNQKFTVINLLKAKSLSLKDLQANRDTNNIQQGKPKDPKAKQELRINDKLTNAIIYTAGAILLGSIIAN